MKSKFAPLLALALLCGVAAHASPILYTVSDTGSGHLGATSFTNQSVVVSFLGDTTGVFGSAGFFRDTAGAGTVKIGGISVATFTDAVSFFVNQTGFPAAGIADATTGGSILDTYNAAFAAYSGTTAIGPLSGLVVFRPDLSFATTSGLFNLRTVGQISTFTATLVSPVPEPSSFVLLATGILGVAGAARRKFLRA